MYKFNDVKVPLDYSDSELKSKIEKMIGIKVLKVKVLKRSIDARQKSNIHYVLSVAIDTARRINLEEYIEPISSLSALTLNKRVSNCSERVAIIGSGPCGLFTALTLAKAGVGVDVYERGECVQNRQKSVLTFQKSGELNVNSNIQFGEGGAGTFSDGKLNTGIKSEYLACVYGEFVRFGANADIEYSAKPHIGTDVLKRVVLNMREELESLGARIRFDSLVSDFDIVDGAVRGIVVNGETLPYAKVILACGHSARDTYEMLLARGVELEKKPFAIGARIEHRQELIDRSQYGAVDDRLPPADYKLACEVEGGRSCFTFCMCPGGEIVPACSEVGGVVTNGMSARARSSGFANSAVLVGVRPSDYGEGALAGVYFQRELENNAYNHGANYSAPAIRSRDLIARRESANIKPLETTYSRGIYCGNFLNSLPEFVISGMINGLQEFGRKIKGFDTDGILVGVESRSSAPLRIVRDTNFESNIKGLFPCGEGAGYAGGISSSAVDGIKVALEIIARLNAK